jgi:plasmid stability protein
MEEEARAILGLALRAERTEQGNLADSIRNRFAATGGVELPQVARERLRRPPRFDR